MDSGRFKDWDVGELLKANWEWPPPLAVEDECAHGALPTDRRTPTGCNCWADLRAAA